MMVNPGMTALQCFSTNIRTNSAKTGQHKQNY